MKQTTGTGTHTPKKPETSRWLLISTAFVTFSFIGLLIYLSTVLPNKNNRTETDTSSSAASASNTQAEPKFTFYTELSTHAVEDQATREARMKQAATATTTPPVIQPGIPEATLVPTQPNTQPDNQQPFSQEVPQETAITALPPSTPETSTPETSTSPNNPEQTTLTPVIEKPKPTTEQRMVEPAKQANSTPQYFVQTDAFRHPHDADERRAQLLLLGLRAQIQPAVLPSGETWYRVTVGPLGDKRTLAKTQSTLTQNGINGVVRTSTTR